MRKHRGGATDVHRRTLVMGGFARADPFRMPEMQVSRLEGAFLGNGRSGGGGLGRTYVTRVTLASAAFRRPARSKQAHCFLGLK